MQTRQEAGTPRSRAKTSATRRRDRAALLTGCLGGDPGVRLRLRPAPLAHHALHLELARHVHDHHGVEGRTLPGLREQGNVVDDEGSLGGRGLDLGGAGTDPGVDDRLQVSSPRLVGEHPGTQRRTVQVTGRSQHLRPEGGHDLLQPVGPPADHLASKQVSVDDHRAKLGQHPGDGALARSDTAGESHTHTGMLPSVTPSGARRAAGPPRRRQEARSAAPLNVRRYCWGLTPRARVKW
jgi:hypothetical protein